jgi:hypothetical protein
MTRFALISALLIDCAATNRAGALFVTLGNTNPALPTEFAYQQSGGLSFNQVVDIANVSPSGAFLLSWQTEFKLSPISGAQGQLLFTSVVPPPSPGLTNFSGPISDLTMPSDRFLAFDVNLIDLGGSLLPAGERRNIMEFTIAASPDAMGSFELVTQTYDPQNPDLGSSWFSALELEPSPFENVAAGSQAGFILLGVFHITQPYPLGDYDRDRDVTEADYLRWREDFASTVASPGDGADGNRDGVVDAADYIIWRRQYSASNSAAFVGDAPVPEPVGLFSTLVVIAFATNIAVRVSRLRGYRCAAGSGRLAD